MWMNLHNEWHDIEKISKKVVVWVLILLFCSSGFPYVTKFVNAYFHNSVAQSFYGIIVLLVTFSNIFLSKAIEEVNHHDHGLTSQIRGRRNWLIFDIGIKVIGLILSITVYPPAMMYSVLFTMSLFLLPERVRYSLGGMKKA